jgi:photosystem II stability/assembly factor-like uncharacterized protein
MVLLKLIPLACVMAALLSLTLGTSFKPTPHRSLIFVNHQTGFVIGDGSFYRTDDGGYTWACLTQRVPGSGAFSPRDGFFLDPNRGWLIADDRILQTADGGMSWDDIRPSERILPECSDNHLAIRFLTPEVGWVAGVASRESSCEYVSYVLRTLNGGRSWQRIIFDRGTRHEFLYELYFQDERRGFAVGLTTIYATEDGGESWVSRSSFPDGHKSPRDWPTIHFVDNTYGWVVANGQLMITRDEGRTWVLDEQLKHIGYIRGSLLISRSTGFVSGDNFLLRTTDGGITWQVVGTGGVVFRMCFVDERTGWTIDSDLKASFHVKKTEDGGASWRTIYRRPYIRWQPVVTSRNSEKTEVKRHLQKRATVRDEASAKGAGLVLGACLTVVAADPPQVGG